MNESFFVDWDNLELKTVTVEGKEFQYKLDSKKGIARIHGIASYSGIIFKFLLKKYGDKNGIVYDNMRSDSDVEYEIKFLVDNDELSKRHPIEAMENMVAHLAKNTYGDRWDEDSQSVGDYDYESLKKKLNHN